MAPPRDDERHRPIPLVPSVQRYAWGDTRFIPEALGMPVTGEPCAEAWFGAHPKAPAMVPGTDGLRGCDELLSRRGTAILGADVAARFAGRLPYLLKLLAARQPLSIQVHPDRAQAAAGFAREEAAGIPRDAPNRCYRDASHKPELLVALTPFVALCGFRPGPERVALLAERFPELEGFGAGGRPDDPASLRTWLEAWFAADEAAVAPALRAAVTRMCLEESAHGGSFPRNDPRRWALAAHRALAGDDRQGEPSGPVDRGLPLVFLLDLMELAPGEAIFLEAGLPHAYLEGAGLELMASSDNVLRGGLTRKHLDPKELLRVVRFDAGRPPVIRPRVAPRGDPHGELRYEPAADEFALDRLSLQGPTPLTWRTEGPETLLALPEDPTVTVQLRTAAWDEAAPAASAPDGGQVATATTEDASLTLGRGGACLLPAGVSVTLTADQAPAVVYRARVPGALARPAFLAAVRRNIDAMDALFRGRETGDPGRDAPGDDGIGPPAVIGTVSGSRGAQAFWQRELDRARPGLRAREARSLHEDLPTNQALGLLLAWQRLRPALRPGEGALLAFVFGEGSRATPLTEAESGQKPAIRSFVATGAGAERRLLSTVELALRTFAPVEAFLRRSGFDGLVVKWGDEVQIPTLDLTGTDARMAEADVVRFVSIARITEDTAKNKDWVGVDRAGRVTAFIPRRPLSAMAPLADRGLLERRGDALYGGINLGSIALSRRLLDLLLDELEDEVNDPDADRKQRPDLDPQLFTALTVAAREDPRDRADAWATAKGESPAIARLDEAMPGIVDRLRRVLDRYRERYGRPARMVALDFGDQFWGDIGQHRQMRELVMALRAPTADGAVARALAGIDGLAPDAWGNVIAGQSRVGAGVTLRGSVLIDAQIDEGEVVDSVLVGSRVGRLSATAAFDVGSVARALRLEPGAGAYRVLSKDDAQPVVARARERVTTVVLPDGPHLFRVHEETDLRDRPRTYDVAVLDNPLSFREAHALVTAADPDALDAVRRRLEGEIRAALAGSPP